MTRIAITRRGRLDIPDGINIFLFSLADELISRGIEVIAVSDQATDESRVSEYFRCANFPQLLSLGHEPSASPQKDIVHSSIKWLSTGRKLIGKIDPDLTIVNGAIPVRLPGYSITVAHDCEGRGGSVTRRAFKATAYRKSSLLAATCSEVRNQTATESLISENRIVTIPTCVNPSQYLCVPLEARDDAILHIGTQPYKNPTATIQAFGLMKHLNTKLYVTGNLTREVSDSINVLPADIKQRVEVLGYVSAARFRELLGRVKLVSCPSEYRTPVASPTVLEAFASGTPVVTTTSITSDLVVSGRNSIVTDATNPLRWAEAQASILNEPGRWSEMSAAARSSINRFSSQVVADTYLSIIDTMANDEA